MLEDASDFIDDFAVDATIGSSTVKVVLDKASFLDDNRGTINTVPSAIGSNDDLSDVVRGDSVFIAGVHYKVSQPPTSDGLLTTLFLRNA